MKSSNYVEVFMHNFLGNAPRWYKSVIISFLVANPILLVTAGPFFTGWVLIAEFIFTLAMALKCYPLPPAGLLAIEGILMGLTNTEAVYEEVVRNFPVLLLLMFMVAGIFFLKSGLLFMFTNILIRVRSKIALSFLFCFMGAVLSAFLDALTVVAVVISVAYGFYGIYHKYQSALGQTGVHHDSESAELKEFRGFLRNLMMHAAVGTALGGALTLVGEPQNLLIGEHMGWNFPQFFIKCLPVSLPVFITGMVTCVLLEITKIAGYGYKLPQAVFDVMKAEVGEQSKLLDGPALLKLVTQGVVAVLLVLSLGFHIAAVGLIGLMVIVLATAFTGITEEHHFGEAFRESLPFTALLVVFFAIVAVIHDQHLFKPVFDAVLGVSKEYQLAVFFLANGLLSAISDNVFVATVYINEVTNAFNAGLFDRAWYEKLAVAVNMGTNIPSVATPNGQAAFLFLLTSSLAPLIRLSYMEMVKLALPYAVTMVGAGLLATMYLL